MDIQTEEIQALEALKNLGQTSYWYTRCYKCDKYHRVLSGEPSLPRQTICQCGTELGKILVCGPRELTKVE